jgi:3-dehydroquinate synthase
MRTVAIHTQRPYEVVIGRGLLARTGERLAALTPARAAAVVSDDAVGALYGGTVERSLTEAGFRVARTAFPRGEASKTLDTCGRILRFLAQSGLTRADTVVALGGGVPGDVAGFAAATYLRGVNVLQIPTTLLAMVDSSVGGKTGVDLPEGKNLAGAFHQPVGVLCDPDALATLPAETFADGAAEALKYGLLCDEALFGTLETGDFKEDPEAVIERCVRIKAEVCAADEREAGRRKLLNLGHTFGHAVEHLSGYRISHGFAVAVGMAYAARIAVSLGRCGETCLARLEAALTNNGLPVRAAFTAEELAEAALTDKKRAGDTLTFVLPNAVGRCELYPVPVGRLPELAKRALGETV